MSDLFNRTPSAALLKHRLVPRPAWAPVGAIVAVTFDVMTILSGRSGLFGSSESRAVVGHAVDFVLWFNFLSGFACIGAMTLRSAFRIGPAVTACRASGCLRLA